MTSETDHEDCVRRCWQIAGAAGVGLFLILWAFAPLGFLKPVLFGLFAFVGVGLGLIYTRCPSVTAAAKPAAKVEAAKPAAVPAPKPEPAPAPKAETAAAPKDAPASVAESEAAKPMAAAVAAGYGAVRPSVALPGQQELASRKGSWTYGAAPAHAAPAGAPSRLSGARGGKADNLKKIKGVGPKLEQVLNAMGFYHFDQIAAWTEAEVAWVDQNLEGFKGRVTRDGWVAQAATLAAGGETEFSRRSS